MPTLILLRHAKAEPAGPTDFQRPLALRGREQLPTVAGHLTKQGLTPDLVLCSAALRTRQTWAGLAAALGGASDTDVSYLEDLYSATPEVVRTAVREHASAGTAVVLVVGHEPIMSMTAAQYADADSDQNAEFSVQMGMPTASMAVIDLPDWESPKGTLRALLRS